MSNQPKHFIIDADALPEIFLKVADVKRALDLGECATVNEAVRQVGISRSAFYKYKDAVRPFNDMLHGRIVTFQSVLRDSPGALSSILSIFAASGANILTINQSIPNNGCAAVTIGVETSEMTQTLEELLIALQSSGGVIKIEILAG